MYGSAIYGSPMYGSAIYGAPIYGLPIMGYPYMGDPYMGVPYMGVPYMGNPYMSLILETRRMTRRVFWHNLAKFWALLLAQYATFRSTIRQGLAESEPALLPTKSGPDRAPESEPRLSQSSVLYYVFIWRHFRWSAAWSCGSVKIEMKLFPSAGSVLFMHSIGWGKVN